MYHLLIINHLKSKRRSSFPIQIIQVLTLLVKLLDLVVQHNKNLKKKVNVKFLLEAKDLSLEYTTQMNVMTSHFMC